MALPTSPRVSRHVCWTLVALVSCLDPGSPQPGNAGLTALTVAAIEEADNGHFTTLSASIDTNFRALNSVSFATSLSTFANGTAQFTAIADSTGVARAFLKAPADSSVVYVTATAGGVAMVRSITFVAAMPAWMTVAAASPALLPNAGATADVTVTLARLRGSVSPGGVMHFTIAGVSSAKVSAAVSVDSTLMTGSSTGTKVVILASDTLGATLYLRARYTWKGSQVLRDSVLITILKKGA